MQLGSFCAGDPAAGRGHDRMAGRDVPFAGGRKARIDIGAAFGHAAKFDRRAERLADRAGPALMKASVLKSPCERLTATIQGVPRSGIE